MPPPAVISQNGSKAKRGFDKETTIGRNEQGGTSRGGGFSRREAGCSGFRISSRLRWAGSPAACWLEVAPGRGRVGVVRGLAAACPRADDTWQAGLATKSSTAVAVPCTLSSHLFLFHPSSRGSNTALFGLEAR